MTILTPKQALVLQIIQQFWQNKNHSPSLGELQKLFQKNGLPAKSKRSVVQYLEVLEKKGYLSRGNTERSINIISPQTSENFADLAILGTANAGSPVNFAEENICGYLKVSQEITRRKQNVFALEVRGDSMNKCQVEGKYIEDGDYVVIEHNPSQITNNDVVLAVIDQCATIKKIKTNLLGDIVLTPVSNNPMHQPIYLHQNDLFFINGKVINVLKSTKNL
ncbi:MAG TPA: transcriptional repressor LexA [Candidatus Gracilibacteria bacterium]|nr:transcriptional repressor LexA [Candidatus Gracilibacteria bacterium]